MWTQYTVEQALAQQERMLAEAAKVRLLKLLPQAQRNPWQKAVRTLNINQLWVVLVLLTVLLFVGCGAKDAPLPVVPEGAQAGDLVDLKPCTYPAGKIEYAADCGTLVVPENRSNPSARLIALPVIRVRALSDSPAEPIFYFQGGPGGTNQHFQYLDGLVDDHDFIQVGYRGVDGSVILDCPEIAEAIRTAPGALLDAAALDAFADASARCATRLGAEGVDLASYTMTAVIDDMEAARAALGYDRINLLGESYGTRLEILYERIYPAVLHRVIMVAVNPPGHFVWEPAAIDAQLEDYAALCAKDAVCSARTDDLIASLRNVSANFPKRWLIFPIDAGGVKLLSFSMLMESTQPPGAPVPLSGPAMIDLWLAAEEGDASGMALITMARSLLANMAVYGDLLAKGSSGGDFARHAADYRTALNPPGAILGSPASLFHSALGAGWKSQLIPEQYLPLQASDVETLLVSGSIDFSTPPQFATKELLPYLRNGEQVILRDFAHTETFWNRQAAARTHLLTTFYRTGEVDDSRYTYEAVDFDQGIGWPGLAKVLLGAALAVIVLLTVLVWLVVRRVWRRRAIESPTVKIAPEPRLKPR
ncbi:MAG: alpha/beta fold hydrolase [Caldilinea sp. CFX5]|nr:alpha/beta fold hydrolase [Caldilinea sp. CFX5]